MFGGTGLAGWFTLLLFSFAVAWLLDQVMNRALAFFLVGLVWLVAALVLYSTARRNLRDVEPLPQTVESIKEDVAWARAPAELRGEIETTRENLGETLDAIGDRLSPSRVIGRRRNRMAAGMPRLCERVMGTLNEAGDKARSQVHSVADASSDGASAVTDVVREAPQRLRQEAQGSPLVVGAIAAGAGSLVAVLLPSTASAGARFDELGSMRTSDGGRRY